jgi:hypothetical protein
VPESQRGSLEGPFAGLDAYLARTPVASLSRAAQLGILGQFAVGTPEQAVDLQDDAAALRVPHGPSAGIRGNLETGVRAIAEDYLRDHVPEALTPNRSELAAQIRAVREAVDEDPGQWSTLALAWVSMRSRSPAERAMAAAVVASYTLDPALEQILPTDTLSQWWESDAPQTHEVLQTSLRSRNKIASQLAAARLGIEAGNGEDSAPHLHTTKTAAGNSVTVHGTWSRMAETAWHRPGDGTHTHIKGTCTPGLYAGADYFRWSGGYSQFERTQASADLVTWIAEREIALDTAYGHSHGGNVLLGAELARTGALLVLLHTPVLPRADEEWARICGTWDRVLIMRARADPVVIADGLRTGSTGEPDRSKLPFRLIRPHIKDKRGWFTHGLFVQKRTWVTYRLSNEVAYERGLPSRRQPLRVPDSESHTVSW